MMKTLTICLTAIIITLIVCNTFLLLDRQRTKLLLEHLDGTEDLHLGFTR